MKFPKNYYNPLSLLGSILASVSALIFVFFVATSWLYEGGGAYSGVIIYIVLPIFLILGLILIPVGIRRRARKIQREGEEGAKSRMESGL